MTVELAIDTEVRHSRVQEALPWLVNPNTYQASGLLFLLGTEKTFRTEVPYDYVYGKIVGHYKPRTWEGHVRSIIRQARQTLKNLGYPLVLYSVYNRAEIRLDENYSEGTNLLPYKYIPLVSRFGEKTDKEKMLALARLLSTTVRRNFQLISKMSPQEELLLKGLAQVYPETLSHTEAEMLIWQTERERHDLHVVTSRLRVAIEQSGLKEHFEIETKRNKGTRLIVK